MSLVSQINDALTRIGTEFKSIRSDYNGKVGTLANLTTTAKGDLVSAINEVDANTASAGAQINDSAATTSTTQVWSISKTNSEIASQSAAAAASVVDAAPAALDTLNELAAALGDDANFATTTSNALGMRVRVDAAQAFTDPQKVQGRSNLGAAASADVGDTTTNFVTTFEAALV